ncbi:MAG: chlorite dismutase family protein [Acidobacteria bacterium]|nr:chlorite dismutase family protein [Acidobacteriota bacterium]
MAQSDEPHRQVVNFVTYKLDPAWRLLAEEQKQHDREQLCRLITSWSIPGRMLILPYSLVGIRADADIMLWRICYQLEELQQMSTEISQTGLGAYLRTTHSFLSMTKRSTYILEHVHEGQVDSRGALIPGQFKYIFVYPFVKTRDWYRLNFPARQGMMNEHITVGHKYPRVKLNTTYSFGLDDQEFVVAFESDYPEDFVDLVMDLRETDASRYTLRDTPILTGVLKTVQGMIETLG